MNENKNMVPKLRFPGFTDAWEQRKLGEISDIKTGPFGSTLHADDYVDDGVPIITTEHFKTGLLQQEKTGLPQVSDDDYKRLSSYTFRNGDIVFSRVGSVDINAQITPFQDGWLFSGRVLRVRPSEEYSSSYLHAVLDTESVKSDIRSRAVGQTMPSINTEILKATELMVSTSLDEQKQIGEFLTKLDETITFHQRKLDSIKEYKAGMLQKMFPRNGETVPEIRFSGFTGEWERRKLGELTRPVRIKAGDSEYPVYSVTNNNGFLPQVEQFIDREVASKNRSNYSVVSHNQFAYNPSRINVGSIAYLKEDIKVIISPLYVVFECTDEIDKDFLDYFVSTNLFSNQREKNTAGSVRDSLSYEGFSDISIVLPSITEQKKIGALFVNIDHAITLLQRKLDYMKEYKKGLLQQMFV